MSALAPIKRRLWPRYAMSPTGDRARVDCPGDIPPGWALETPLPGTIEAERAANALDADSLNDAEAVAAPPKNKGGRPKKVFESSGSYTVPAECAPVTVNVTGGGPGNLSGKSKKQAADG